MGAILNRDFGGNGRDHSWNSVKGFQKIRSIEHLD